MQNLPFHFTLFVAHKRSEFMKKKMLVVEGNTCVVVTLRITSPFRFSGTLLPSSKYYTVLL